MAELVPRHERDGARLTHCNGMNRLHPSAMARMRGIKAEGGWSVVCTEQCDVHHSGCYPRELRLWDARDVPILARMCDEVHAHGALAGIELAHNGSYVTNPEIRTIPIAPSCMPTRGTAPVTARAIDKADLLAARRWHVTAARNARAAGYDIVYVYAGHDMTLPAHFLSRRHNKRTDEYGGSLRNRTRFPTRGAGRHQGRRRRSLRRRAALRRRRTAGIGSQAGNASLHRF